MEGEGHIKDWLVQTGKDIGKVAGAHLKKAAKDKAVTIADAEAGRHQVVKRVASMSRWPAGLPARIRCQRRHSRCRRWRRRPAAGARRCYLRSSAVPKHSRRLAGEGVRAAAEQFSVDVRNTAAHTGFLWRRRTLTISVGAGSEADSA